MTLHKEEDAAMSCLAGKRKRKGLVWVAAIVVVLLVIIAACAIYLNDYYRADTQAIAALAPADGVTKQMLPNDTMVYAPENAQAGMIFYPGGKVEHTAYGPLMEACAAEGILCVLVEMPFRLAVLDMDAAEGIQEQFPEIETWYIGGHSLGGSMAASYLSGHADEYAGLILLGSYSTADLSGGALEVLSVYGSEDTVLNREKYDENKANLPEDFAELVIEGGCHAYFGMYGAQDGDGVPTITNEEQIAIAVDAITGFIFE